MPSLHAQFSISNCQNSHFTYYSHTARATYYVTDAVLLSCTYPQLIFDLAYYTLLVNLILLLNLNYKRLLKSVDITNFLHTNLSYEKAKNAPLPPPYLYLTEINLIDMIKLIVLRTLNRQATIFLSISKRNMLKPF